MGREAPIPQRAADDSSRPQVNGLAIASFVSGCLFFLLPAAVAAIVLGHVSRKQIRESEGRLEGAGMARTGLSLGYAGVALMAALVIVAGIARPKIAREHMLMNEASIIRSLRYLSYVSATYSKTYQHGFPPTLKALGPPLPGERESEAAANLIGPELASGARKGYNYTYRAKSSLNNGTIDGFTINADPVTPGETGERHFFVDQTGVIRAMTKTAASGTSPPVTPDVGTP